MRASEYTPGDAVKKRGALERRFGGQLCAHTHHREAGEGALSVASDLASGGAVSDIGGVTFVVFWVGNDVIFNGRVGWFLDLFDGSRSLDGAGQGVGAGGRGASCGPRGGRGGREGGEGAGGEGASG